MADQPGFLDELKRRKVVRVAVVYLAVAWAVVQVADVFVPALDLPESIISAVAVLALLGFPVALVLAWAFEVTPDGVKRTLDVDGSEGGTVGGQSAWFTGTTLVVAAVLVVGGYFAGRLTGGNDAGDGLDRMAVAVLPFDARGAADEVGFADGVHDDILTQLSRIDALRVTSRTSVQGYRGTTMNIRAIAAELGVGAVLEGGVQRTADRVRINMQLIDGTTDEHLWAETFDRELTAENIFAIQSEIARAVAEALEATLTADDESDLAEVPTQNLEALDLFHRARRLFDELGIEGRAQAATVLEQAVAIDPSYTRAWAELTRARSWAIREGRAADTVPPREAMERTLELAPGSVDAALAAGNYRYYARGDMEGALRAFQQAAGGQSGDADLTFSIANVLRRLGRWEESTAMYEEVVRLEPRNARVIYDLAWQYMMLRDFGRAEQTIQRYRALAPEETSVLGMLVEAHLLGSGDTLAATAVLDEWEALTEDALPAVYRSMLAYFQGDRRALNYDLRQDTDRISFGSYWLYPDGSSELWRARMAWVMGEPEMARRLGAGMEAGYVAITPGLLPGANAIPEGGDLFGVRATQYLLRAWELAFAGEDAQARETADEAIGYHSIENDGTDGVFFVRQRMLIRIVTGDLDGAMVDLRELLARPGLTTAWELRLDPIYQPLRERADFQELMTAGM